VLNKINMKVSIIIAIYKDIEALSIILESLKLQTYKNFEVIVAEDNNSRVIKDYIESINGLDIYLVSQADCGIRKTRSLNNGIIKSTGELLVFIDGDCVPYTTFVEGYVLSAEKGYILSGRRVNLGPDFSRRLRNKLITPYYLEKKFVYQFLLMSFDSIEGHTEEGFYFNPNTWIYKNIIKKRKLNTSIVGCNYGCFREDMITINGYDEGYGETSIGDDTDIQWRFEGYGLKIKSVRYVSNVFHLYHGRGFRENIPSFEERLLMEYNKKNNTYRCKRGISEH